MSTPRRTTTRGRAAGAVWRRLPPALAAILTVAVAATATLGAIRFLQPEEPRLTAGAPRRPTPSVAAPSGALATASPVASPASPAPASSGRPTRQPRNSELVDVRLPAVAAGAQSPGDEIARLLAVAPGGSLVASVERFGMPGPLHVTHQDGRDAVFQLGEPGIPAPIAAAFAPDSAWLAAVDGAGTLWRVDLETQATSVIASASDGLVFGLAVDFLPDGRLLVTRVGSVEMPLPSHLAAVDPATGEIEQLSAHASAYQPIAIDDGSIIFFAALPDGTTEARRVSNGSESVIAQLGQTVSVDASRDGALIAVERHDENVVLVDTRSGASRALASGARPEFSPEGDRLIVLDLNARVARELDLAGNELSRRPSLLVAWAECPEGCAP